MLEFLNVDNARINIDGKSLMHNVQDNSFCTQSEKLDYLLDFDRNVINVFDGEIYVPLGYLKDGTAKIGDKTVIEVKKLTVADFLRDSKMNSLFASIISNMRKIGI